MNNFKEKVYGMWLGKAIGGTLGMPWEGCSSPLSLTFYTPEPTEMMPNDDLDLQILWACKLSTDWNYKINRQRFLEAWRDCVRFPFDEYGIALRNISIGLKPPYTGSYDNWFVDGLGAAIRSELWAALAPGDPAKAVAYAYEDACVDHKGDGLYAEQYLAAEISFKDLVFMLDTPKPVAPVKYEINKGRLTKVSGKINDENGGKIGILPASEGVGAYMSFNAYKAAQAKAPFGVIFFTPPPQGGKRSDFVFMAKSDKDIVMELNIPNAGWKGQTIRDVIISGGNEWQEIRVSLKGKPAEQGNLMGQIYFHYKSRSNPKADYPAVNLSIKNLSFE